MGLNSPIMSIILHPSRIFLTFIYSSLSNRQTSEVHSCNTLLVHHLLPFPSPQQQSQLLAKNMVKTLSVLERRKHNSLCNIEYWFCTILNAKVLTDTSDVLFLFLCRIVSFYEGVTRVSGPYITPWTISFQYD